MLQAFTQLTRQSRQRHSEQALSLFVALGTFRKSADLHVVKSPGDDPEAILQLGVAHATVQCVELLAGGVPGIHFYTLNRSRASRMIVTALQLQSPTLP